MDKRFKIYETQEHGVILEIYDTELADKFDDYLNENCYVFSELRFESDYVCFYFGQASHLEKVGILIKNFLNK